MIAAPTMHFFGTPSAVVVPKNFPSQSNLLFYWSMDGSATDSSSYGRNGTTSNIRFVTGTYGKLNAGAASTANNSYISTSNRLTYAQAMGTHSIAFWHYPAPFATVANSWFWSPSTANAQIYSFNYLTVPGRILYQKYNGGAKNAASCCALTESVWNHVVIQLLANGTVATWFNATQSVMLVNTAGVGASYVTDGEGIGATRAGNTSSGSIDEYGFWNCLLTQNDINKLYNYGNGLGYNS